MKIRKRMMVRVEKGFALTNNALKKSQRAVCPSIISLYHFFSYLNCPPSLATEAAAALTRNSSPTRLKSRPITPKMPVRDQKSPSDASKHLADGSKFDSNQGLSLITHEKNNQILSTHAQQFLSSRGAGSGYENMEIRKQKLREIIHLAPILELKVLSTGSLPRNHKFTINAQGAVNSFRNAKDGITYFGCEINAPLKQDGPSASEAVNDCIIPSPNLDTSERHRGRHLQIAFDISSNSYKLKDLGVGFGCFYKLDFPVALKDNHLFNFGMIFMLINFQEPTKKVPEASSKDLSLLVKFYGGVCNGEVRVIETTNTRISIGRHSDCDIQLNDNLLSKYQCSLEYSPNIGWSIKDGVDGRPSTNGTWLYVGEEQTIYNGMIFKANQTLLQASLI